MGMEDYQITEVKGGEAIIQLNDGFDKANVDAQVATAKQYPRDVIKCVNNNSTGNNGR